MTTHNALFQQCLAEVPQTQRAEFELCQNIADRIDDILHRKHLTQRDLAKMIGKRESEVSRWMTGRHNFTMKTIASISVALGEPIISVTKDRYANSYSIACEDACPYNKQ